MRFLLFVCLQIICHTFLLGERQVSLVPKQSFEMNISRVPYNQMQIKVSHYKEFKEVLMQNSAENCLGLEFDLVQKAEQPWDFYVQKGDTLVPFQEALTDLKEWSQAHPGHFILTIYLNISAQSVYGDDVLFCDQLDGLITQSLGIDQIYIPAYLQRDARNLLEGAKYYGWPKHAEMRDCFLFILSGKDSDRLVARRKMIYSYREPHKRLSFVDLDQNRAKRYSKENLGISNPYFQEGSRVFIKLEPSSKDWRSLAKEAYQEGFICHLKFNSSEDKWPASQLDGALVQAIFVEKAFKNPVALLEDGER